MEETILVKDLDRLPDAAEKLLGIIRANDFSVILLEGAMGAGKTTLTKALCDELGVGDTVTSPTFALVNEYSDREGNPVYHFDFYRIDSLEEAFDLGYDEYFYSGNLCLVEWPEKIAPLIPGDDEPDVRVATVHIDVDDDDRRRITVTEGNRIGV